MLEPCLGGGLPPQRRQTTETADIAGQPSQAKQAFWRRESADEGREPAAGHGTWHTWYR
ncbi:hypothetical protein LEL_08484 [Akanthomyces lecanii RCEF 1005]|uniref:Uncharacterized protein n=1 Tax=Akanthomyces lecanii RCEF 1005 TaxID=1081108 RepID=A0A168DJQ7_CORDF|nr:hypothetical protein LEL_08484 [Akanthomyces lecanii RCEF 1005]